MREKRFQNLDVFLMFGDFRVNKLCLQILQNKLQKDKKKEIFTQLLELYGRDLDKMTQVTNRARTAMLAYLYENYENYHEVLGKASRKDYLKNKETLEVMRKSFIIYLEEACEQGILTEKITIFDRVKVLERDARVAKSQNNPSSSANLIKLSDIEQCNLEEQLPDVHLGPFNLDFIQIPDLRKYRVGAKNGFGSQNGNGEQHGGAEYPAVSGGLECPYCRVKQQIYQELMEKYAMLDRIIQPMDFVIEND